MEAEVTVVRGGRGAAEAEVHVMCGFQDEHMFVTHTVHDLTLHQVLHSTKHKYPHIVSEADCGVPGQSGGPGHQHECLPGCRPTEE